MAEFRELEKESIAKRKECSLCKETALNVGQKTEYGSVMVYKSGNTLEDGWFATLSPKTGSGPKKDFSIQLMPFGHLTHFGQLGQYPKLAENYGTAFSRISNAVSKVMAEEMPEFETTASSRPESVSVATYGKCTNWSEKKEHLHLKIFPFRGNIGQPYTVDSSFGRKPVFKGKNGKEFVKMNPVKKVHLEEQRLNELSKKLIGILSEAKK